LLVWNLQKQTNHIAGSAVLLQLLKKAMPSDANIEPFQGAPKLTLKRRMHLVL
jgi:hypothetical protein